MKQSLILFIVVTMGHMLEEYLGNTSMISLEGIMADKVAPILFPKYDPKTRTPDNDYLQNSIGDIFSGIVACVFIIWYWKKRGKLPYLYFFGLVPMYFILRHQLNK